MKEISEKLKKTRENMGLSLEEVASDLNYKISQIEDVENANYQNFKDKFELKTIFIDYSKYLGLDSEKIVDEFNDFVFESTSKIPLDDIAKASKIKAKKENDKIASPYTATKKKNKIPKYIYIILLLILVILIVIFICINNKPKVNKSFNNISYIGGNYEERI